MHKHTLCTFLDSNPKESDADTVKEGGRDVVTETNIIDEGGNSLEIIVGEDRQKRHKLLQKCIRKGDWSKAERILKANNHLVTEAISTDSNTMLHFAVGIYRNDFLKKLIFYMNAEEVLEPRKSDGSTALHIAVTVGNTHAAKLLVIKNSKLLEISDHNAKTPLQKAYENMHLYTIDYLLKAVKEGSKPKSPTTSLARSSDNIEKIEVDLLVNAISAKHYSKQTIQNSNTMHINSFEYSHFLFILAGLASKLVKQGPTSASKSEDVLMAIPKTFPSGLDYWESLVYPPCMFLVYDSYVVSFY
ncbi:putative ankyrin repeat-containing domain-containing protein [Helianthus anomalus]